MLASEKGIWQKESKTSNDNISKGRVPSFSTIIPPLIAQ